MTFRLRVDAPEAFDGTGDYLDWQARFIAYLGLESKRYVDITKDYLAGADHCFSDAELNQVYDLPMETQLGRELPEEKKACTMSNVIYNLLMQKTKGQAYVLIRTCAVMNGFECLRTLQSQFGRARRQRVLLLVDRIVNFKLHGQNVSEKLVR
jgi:hypothetical protein